MASGNTSSAAPAEPVGNRMCVPLPAGISAVTFIFPLSGSAGAPAAVSGTYWPATFDRPGYFYSCAVTGSSAVVTPIVNVDLGYSVRCVRAREEQAIPLFWIVWFWSSLNLLRDWPEFGASSWVRRSVSGLFSNPPEAELFPVMLRRFPRRNRSATRFVLSSGILAVTFIFPVGRVELISLGC